MQEHPKQEIWIFLLRKAGFTDVASMEPIMKQMWIVTHYHVEHQEV